MHDVSGNSMLYCFTLVMWSSLAVTVVLLLGASTLLWCDPVSVLILAGVVASGETST